MKNENTKFEINFLDHIAIRVQDLNESAAWYEKVLGLKRYSFAEWGPYPIMLMAGKSGLALFPRNNKRTEIDDKLKRQRMDHFAFNVSNANFEKAKRRFDEMEIPYQIQDHYYFHSIYIKDPDDYIVELTTIVVDDKTFY